MALKKLFLVLALVVLIVDGHAPGARELRNPDAEGGTAIGRLASPHTKRPGA
ncbi:MULTISPECIES: hypothetical protein [Methylobacterium]|uniref:Uncharacterized protein n=1 Tax=Methylobacterium jeotgali TaxID=381630 RepID=A0ABQ4SV69_9HYPH|nr:MULTISPECIES: hypothetical protein [Methylobacterium]GBU19132.1 hypothetical protein AwMethylo_33470 [Methylobacterium sp.]GJE05768.1 hypothetical protein AOPFMNJM_1074 [Methylobacterium jeotgali]